MADGGIPLEALHSLALNSIEKINQISKHVLWIKF